MDLSGDLEGLLAARPKARIAQGRLSLGIVIGSWRIEAFLGTGRSAEVYRVTHVRMGGEGALKLLIDDSNGLGERFRLEMDALRTLAIPSLPRFFAAGICAGRPYYVMEYLQPLTLPLVRRDIMPFMLSLAHGVDALHAAGYLHRDLKPANILRRRSGKPVLIDLGLIKRIAPAAGAAVNRPSAPVGVSIVDGQCLAVGTRGFAAPEQLLEGKASVRSDVYALGKMMRACGGKALGVRARAVIRKACAEDPEERYASAAEFAAALRRCQGPSSFVRGAIALVVGMAFGGGVFLGAAFLSRTPSDADAPSSPPVAAPPTVASTEVSLAREPGESDEAYLVRMRTLARDGNGAAQCRVGEAYFHGRGTAQDYTEAVRWYASAADAGEIGAQASLGLCHLRGWGCEANPRKAAYWFHRAAKAGHLGSMVDLAFCYHTGLGVGRDDLMAFAWAMQAAVRGHQRGQCMVGEFYLDGIGVEKDRRRADDWLQRAARQGDERAQELLRTR
ncbi:MAG: serine/threonine-protein kinase [Kiritimatiellia bacterium]